MENCSGSKQHKLSPGKGPTELFSTFMNDCELRRAAVVLTAVAEPLEHRYAKDLKAQSGVESEMLAWTTVRAQGVEWWATSVVSGRGVCRDAWVLNFFGVSM